MVLYLQIEELRATQQREIEALKQSLRESLIPVIREELLEEMRARDESQAHPSPKTPASSHCGSAPSGPSIFASLKVNFLHQLVWFHFSLY